MFEKFDRKGRNENARNAKFFWAMKWFLFLDTIRDHVCISQLQYNLLYYELNLRFFCKRILDFISFLIINFAFLICCLQRYDLTGYSDRILIIFTKILSEIGLAEINYLCGYSETPITQISVSLTFYNFLNIFSCPFVKLVD